jgi:hypothetical protein
VSDFESEVQFPGLFFLLVSQHNFVLSLPRNLLYVDEAIVDGQVVLVITGVGAEENKLVLLRFLTPKPHPFAVVEDNRIVVGAVAEGFVGVVGSTDRELEGVVVDRHPSSL